MSEVEGVGRFEWERVIRRVRLPLPVKAFALTLATYADSDGSNVYPGNERLALVTDSTDKTVRRNVAVLRDLGLIERTFSGSRHGRGKADEYRLTLPADLFDRVAMLTPDEKEPPDTDDRWSEADPPASHEEPPVTHDRDHRSLMSEPPVTHDRPPPHAPPHRPVHEDKASVSAGPVEGSHDAPRQINEDNQPEHLTAGANGGHDSAAYKRASAALQQLPDLGETYMRRARDALGEKPLRELVIHAAQLASSPDDAERQTSA